MHATAKVLLVAAGVPLATWLGIGAYWEWLRWTHEAPTYHVASMARLRACLFAPLQLIVMGVLAFVTRAAIRETSWRVLMIACAVAAVLGAAGDAIGLHYELDQAPTAAHRVWDLSPHLVGPAVLLLLVLASLWVPHRTTQPSSAPSDRG
jgi:hypothetical protein